MNIIGKIIAPFIIHAAGEGSSATTGCTISPFDIRQGITPSRFQSATNIASTVGWCDALQIVSNVIGLLYSVVLPIAGLMIVVGAFILFTSGGNEKRVGMGKGFIKSAVIGVAIALGAGVIIGIVIRSLGLTSEATSLMPWLF
ncbi:MAG: hypothetical protein WC565_02265 [Parcubacteria group bacterium]